MPPAMVSIISFCGVGELSRTKRTPADSATSRKRTCCADKASEDTNTQRSAVIVLFVYTAAPTRGTGGRQVTLEKHGIEGLGALVHWHEPDRAGGRADGGSCGVEPRQATHGRGTVRRCCAHLREAAA